MLQHRDALPKHDHSKWGKSRAHATLERQLMPARWISYLQVKDEVVEAFLRYAVMEANCKRTERRHRVRRGPAPTPEPLQPEAWSVSSPTFQTLTRFSQVRRPVSDKAAAGADTQGQS